MARDGRSASAMKWQNRIAEGFSPGEVPNNKCALKGRPSGLSVTHERPMTRFVFEVCHARPVGIIVGRHFPSFVPHSRNYGGQAEGFRVATLTQC